MKSRYLIEKISLTLLIITIFASCQGTSKKSHDQHHHHDDAQQFERGSHGGRLLEDQDFALELKIFETGVPPQYRIYGLEGGNALLPQDFSATVSLTRLGGIVEKYSFYPLGEYLTSDKDVAEPHSFEVVVNAQYKEKEYSWRFTSFEGRTSIADDVAKHSGIETQKVTTRVIQQTVALPGKVFPSEHRIAHIIPRFPGVVREGRKHIGDRVTQGEVLAVIESNESLQPFDVRSQIAGTVINGHLIVGEFVPQNQWVYIVADLSEVWVDFLVPLTKNIVAREGQKIRLTGLEGDRIKEGIVSYVAPYADERAQAQLIRVVIENSDTTFLPGMFITGNLVVDEINAPVAIKKKAIQSFRDWQVAFAKVGTEYEIKPLTLGKSDDEWIEVLSGLQAGEEYVTENAFLIKADILKSGASHDH